MVVVVTEESKMLLPTLPPKHPLDECRAKEVATLRDVFAWQALQAELMLTRGIPSDPEARQQVAAYSYFMADAMLAERKK